MNVSVSITKEGISPNIANHRELRAKILVYRRQVLRWFLIYLVLSNHTQMHIWFTLFEIKRSHHYYLTEGNGVEEILERLKSMCLWKLLMLLPLSIYGPNHQSCKLSTIRRMSFLTFVQSMKSESIITRLDLIWDSYPDQSYSTKDDQVTSFQ